MSISPDGLYVATASDDMHINIHPIAGYPLDPPPETEGTNENTTPAPSSSRSSRLRRLKGHTAPVLSTAFSPKSDMLVSGSFDESAIVWDVQGGRVLRVLPAHSEAVWTVGWDREGAMVFTGSADGLM